MEALGQTIAWAVASKEYISPWALIGMNFGGLFIALILAFFVVRNLSEIDAKVPIVVDTISPAAHHSHKHADEKRTVPGEQVNGEIVGTAERV